MSNKMIWSRAKFFTFIFISFCSCKARQQSGSGILMTDARPVGGFREYDEIVRDLNALTANSNNESKIDVLSPYHDNSTSARNLLGQLRVKDSVARVEGSAPNALSWFLMERAISSFTLDYFCRCPDITDAQRGVIECTKYRTNNSMLSIKKEVCENLQDLAKGVDRTKMEILWDTALTGYANDTQKSMWLDRFSKDLTKDKSNEERTKTTLSYFSALYLNPYFLLKN